MTQRPISLCFEEEYILVVSVTINLLGCCYAPTLDGFLFGTPTSADIGATTPVSGCADGFTCGGATVTCQANYTWEAPEPSACISLDTCEY